MNLTAAPRIYADFNATGMVGPEHWAALTQRVLRAEGNPSSQHTSGRGAKVAMEMARTSVARLIGADPLEIVFTSGATESNNLALQGKALQVRSEGRAAGRLVTTTVEHSSVLEPARLWHDRYGGEVVRVGVDGDGRVDPAAWRVAMAGDVQCVAIILANNETGVVTDIVPLVEAARQLAPTAHIHVDGVQALGRLDVGAVTRLGVDSMAFSGHKLGALKGCGVMYLRSGVRLEPLTAGGSQERNRRPGTESLPAIISMGLRCDDLHAVRPWEGESLRQYQAAMTRLEERLAGIPGLVVHGRGAPRLWNTLNFHVDGVGGDAMLMNLDLAGVDASSGSACSTGVGRPSHVLRAMGYGDAPALNSVRLSFGYDFSVAMAERVGQVVIETVARTR